MLCCSNAKKQKTSQSQNAIKLQTHQIQQEESLNINDEACTFHTTIQIQQFNTIQTYKITLDHQTIRSNSRTNNEHLAQTVIVEQIRKTPFFTYKKGGTDISTKFLSTKQGYTLLVTALSK
ncbi:unnamed protein product (macronuclear) [Paramecium tetraurelia]|uniref:Uncharacterized protein n=1 Tax=Paramecium tetraurelia TaxID=5888 RepID=A0BZU4_PARTE|nr:uncharacterized protein GSPATT00005913001 [Paramecium tetraurelia]CAK64061.1 unnamed protein product [Paramecium tetraurelia]|eukprot:XP_001431459.1 hypothetical protein (macronuclear) [Paramecium tetraurelia strain d4-2]